MSHYVCLCSTDLSFYFSYAPVVCRTFFDQLQQQGIPMDAALKHASAGITTVVLTGTDGGKPMFFHALFQTISEFEHRM